MELKRYIGDGVYAEFDGFGIWLHVNRFPNRAVYLEVKVFENLNDFYDRIVEEISKQNTDTTSN